MTLIEGKFSIVLSTELNSFVKLNHYLIYLGSHLKVQVCMSHYKEEYFNWQKEVGEFGGIANLFKFEKHIALDDSVIDFGSGGGFLLANLNCKQKIGVEINDVARSYSKELGIESVESIEMVEDNWADVIISNHALEHVENPLSSLKKILSKLKTGGKIIFVVPHERKQLYKENDKHQHLFTWSEANLGNLLLGSN